jgi:hypothetical protein
MTINLHILTAVRKTISYREFIQATLKNFDNRPDTLLFRRVDACTNKYLDVRY